MDDKLTALKLQTVKKDWIIFFVFLLLAFLLRSSSFFQSVLDWDEGLYLLMARSLLNGDALYTVVWDNKPPGIYLLFALAQMLFGNTVLSIRLIAWISVSISCYLLYRLGVIIGRGDKRIGFLAGVFYVVFSLNSQGLASNTEIFFTPFIVLAFLLLFTVRAYPLKLVDSNSLRFFAIGLVAGIGFEIKYVVIFDFMAILLIIARELYSQNRDDIKCLLKRASLSYFLLWSGFILPFLLVSLYFLLIGHYKVYIYANFIANIINSTHTYFSLSYFLQVLGREIVNNSILWVGLFLTPVYLFFFRDIDREQKGNLIALLIWFPLAFLGVSYTKLFFSHYFLQLLPALCLLSAFIVIRTVGIVGEMDVKKQYFVFMLVLLGPLAFNALHSLGRGSVYAYFRYVKGIANWGDEPAILAKYLSDRVGRGDLIYAVDYPPILYYMIPVRAPTKYVFPLFLIDEHFSKVAGVDPIQELDNIMAQKPIYIVKQYQGSSQLYRKLDNYLENDYAVEWSINNVRLYRLISDLE